VKETFHTFEDDQWVNEIYEQDILEFHIPNPSTEKTYPMAPFPRITSGDPMDISGGEPADPLESITEASVISSNEGPIHSDKGPRRTGDPYPPGHLRGIGARIKDSGSGRQQGSPKPRDNNAFLKALPARAGRAMRHLDGKIATNQVKLGDLDEQVQGLVQEIQSTLQDVEDGKQLDTEKPIAFEGIIVAVENATQTRQEEIIRLALELDHARKQQQEANERQSGHEVVSSQLHANIIRQGETSANRANALEQEVIRLRAQYAADVTTLQQVANGHAESQERVTRELFAQMTNIMQKLASFQPTPTTTTPAPLLTQVPAAPQVPTNADRVQRWAQERREQNAREQGRQDKGKQREGEPPRPENQGGGNQGPPPPPQYNNPDFSDDRSDQGGRGGGGGGNLGWRPDRGDPIAPQVAMMAQAIGIAIANSGKRQADAPLPFKNQEDQNVKLWLLQCEDYFKRNPNQWRSDQDRIKYALGRMEGEDVSAFAFT